MDPRNKGFKPPMGPQSLEKRRIIKPPIGLGIGNGKNKGGLLSSQ